MSFVTLILETLILGIIIERRKFLLTFPWRLSTIFRVSWSSLSLLDNATSHRLLRARYSISDGGRGGLDESHTLLIRLEALSILNIVDIIVHRSLFDSLSVLPSNVSNHSLRYNMHGSLKADV